jgi:DNA repair exonuclease SbcCD nuclease subunit
MIIFSDLHLHEDSEETVLNQVLPGIYDAAIEREETDIACLGDVLHFRYMVEARLQNRLKDEFHRWVDAGLNLRILPGNHDLYDLEGRNALELFDEIEGVKVYTEAKIDRDGFWIPYRRDSEYVTESVRYFWESHLKDKRVCFMHNGLQGALMNDSFKDTEGVQLDTFDGFETVLLGHYHKRQTICRGKTMAHYIGSPYQTRADEAGQPKGFAIWDGKKLEYVDTQWGKRYHRLSLDSPDDLQVDDFESGDDVRVTTAVGVDPSVVSEKLIKAGVQNHTVTPDVEPVQTRLEVPENADLLAYTQAYVDAQETHLDKEKLMEHFHEFRRELGVA